jgi:tryptophan synthase alpha chain
MKQQSARTATLFAQAKKVSRGVLVAYLCIGDPSPEASLDIAKALIDAGVDAIELGAPFSDPTADGPTIQRASTRAICAGGSLRKTIEIGAKLRKYSPATPLIVFGYLNPVIVCGERAIVDAIADAGLDGQLLVDLPPEEGADYRAHAQNKGLDIISLLTPTSTEARVAAVESVASGFVYYVSVAGVTGTLGDRADPFRFAGARAHAIGQKIGLPTVIGFGIDSADKVRRALFGGEGGVGADGVVVGSAIVNAIESANGDVREAIARSTALVRELQKGLKK